MRVFVYYNLTRKCWSVKALAGQCKGRVILHANKVLVRDAEFKVSEAGRQRTITSGRKQVHAGVVGEAEGCRGETTRAWGPRGQWIGDMWAENWDHNDAVYAEYARKHGDPVTYNPHKWAHFMTCPGECQWEPVHEAGMVLLDNKRRVYAFDPCDMPERYEPKHPNGTPEFLAVLNGRS